MTTYTVTTNADSGAGSLRQAILDANSSGGGSINFAASLTGQTIIAGSVANGPLPVIQADISIDGAAAPGLTISGADTYRVFFVLSGNVSISNLDIINGSAAGGDGGIGGSSGLGAGGGGGLGAGGAIFVNAGTVT